MSEPVFYFTHLHYSAFFKGEDRLHSEIKINEFILYFAHLHYLCSGMITDNTKNADFTKVKVIAFDADDTLWDCQSHFELAVQRYCKLLSPWGTADEISQALYQVEKANMPSLGYGCKAFTLSLIENAVRVSHGEITGVMIHEVMQLGRNLLMLPATPLDGVENVLKALQTLGRYRLVVFTKGELLDQENKLKRSGLEKYFEYVEIVSDKMPQAYVGLCEKLNVKPQDLLMVGNSFKSDIAPALSVGASAVYIPFHVTWQLEHTEEYDHHRLEKLNHISELLPLFVSTR